MSTVPKKDDERSFLLPLLLPRHASPLRLAGLLGADFALTDSLVRLLIRLPASSSLLPFPLPLAGVGTERGIQRANPDIVRGKDGQKMNQIPMSAVLSHTRVFFPPCVQNCVAAACS